MNEIILLLSVMLLYIFIMLNVKFNESLISKKLSVIE